MRNKKSIMIGILCALVCVMAVGYALLAQELNINGRASIDSTWKVEITNITEKDIVGDATSKEVPSYTATTANFCVGLIQPGDSITYDIEISNLGTLKAKVDSINVIMDENDAITYTTSGVQQGDKLGVGEKATLSVKVEYNPEVTSQPSNTGKDLTVTINYVQDLGASNEPSITYDTYSIGDVVNFAGSNWYVIKNSSSEEDYVTLMKEKVLTNAELGEYAINYICPDAGIAAGCPYIGYIISTDTMAYYWSDTCHWEGSYNYTDSNSSECEGYNNYEGSKVREFLEGTYINTLGSHNLKEADGYKIRLVTLDELQNDLGYVFTRGPSFAYYAPSTETTPSWVYNNFGEYQNNVGAYWTMTSNSGSSSEVLLVSAHGNTSYVSFDNSNYRSGNNGGVRPVINLLKSSI